METHSSYLTGLPKCRNACVCMMWMLTFPLGVASWSLAALTQKDPTLAQCRPHYGAQHWCFPVCWKVAVFDSLKNIAHTLGPSFQGINMSMRQASVVHLRSNLPQSQATTMRHATTIRPFKEFSIASKSVHTPLRSLMQPSKMDMTCHSNM